MVAVTHTHTHTHTNTHDMILDAVSHLNNVLDNCISVSCVYVRMCECVFDVYVYVCMCVCVCVCDMLPCSSCVIASAHHILHTYIRM